MLTNQSSRTKLPKKSIQNIPSLDLLHNGIRRKLSKQEYVNFFTKIKIASKSRIQSTLPIHPAQTGSHIQVENERLKQQIRRLGLENDDLRSKMVKQQKIEKMVMKKIQDQQITQLSYQRALEIKLLLESQELTSTLKQTSQRFDRILRNQKIKSENRKNDSDIASINLHAVLMEESNDQSQVINHKEMMLIKAKNRLARIRQKTYKMKEARQGRRQELKVLNDTIQKAKDRLPATIRVKDENQSGIFGSQFRANTIESIQRDISSLKQQSSQIEKKIQLLTEDKIKSKLYFLKEIHQMDDQITNVGQSTLAIRRRQ